MEYNNEEKLLDTQVIKDDNQCREVMLQVLKLANQVEQYLYNTSCICDINYYNLQWVIDYQDILNRYSITSFEDDGGTQYIQEYKNL